MPTTTSEWFAQSGGAMIGRLWVANAMNVMLMKPSFVPNIDTQLRYSDIVAQEVAAGGGYTAGGKVIPNRTQAYDAAAKETPLLGDDVSWGPGATFDTAFAVVYEAATADKYVWQLIRFGATISVVNGTFLVDFVSGIGGVVAGPPV